MGDIIWLASYPKSGNTWLRVFLANWISGLDQPVSINELGKYGLGFQDTDEGVWQAVCGGKPDEDEQIRRRAEVQRAFPSWVERELGVKSGSGLLVKTHSLRGIFNGHPLIAPDATRSAIYIVRDPRKVAPSFARYYSYSHDETVRLMSDSSAAISVNGISQIVGSWSEHVTSWAQAALVLRYEDLPGAFSAVIEFFGLPKDERLTRAQRFSELAELKSQEAREGYKAGLHGEFFGGQNEALSAQQIAEIERDHGVVMRRFRYL